MPLLIEKLTALLPDFRDVGSAVLVTVANRRLTFRTIPVLVDPDGQVFNQYERLTERDISLFGLDRYGAVVHQDTCRAEQSTPALRKLLDAIAFSEMLCPE